MPIIYRNILPKDSTILAGIIRSSIESLGLPTEGTAHSDPTTDNLFQLFSNPRSQYLVAELNGVVVGGCGIFPSTGLPETYAELVRFFLKEEARGIGIGKSLMEQCETIARNFGYTHLYLESFPSMEAAIHLYVKAGYKKLNQPLGNTGHFSCNVWMEKEMSK